MNKLPKSVVIKGVQLPGLTADLIKRQGRVAMYLRKDGYYETGILQVLPAGEVFGKKYPERERYWYSEDFGTIAKTTNEQAIAETHFKEFVKHIKSLKNES